MKRLLVYIFIPILAILLMSHNTSAIISEPVQYVTGGYSRMDLGTNTSDPGISCVSYCDFSTNTNNDVSVGLTRLNMPVTSGPYYHNQIVKIDFILWKVSYNTSLHANLNNIVSTTHDATVIAVESDMVDTNTTIVHVYFKVNSDAHFNGFSIGANNNLFFALLEPGERISSQGWSVYQIIDFGVDTQSIVNAINNMPSAPSASDIGNAVNAPDEQAANDIQNQSPSDIGNSTNAETQSLLTAFGSFVSAIASISPSNCNVDFDLGHIDFGEQNLCSISVPTVFTTITSIIVIMFTIPFVYHLVNRILGLIREMQT